MAYLKGFLEWLFGDLH